MLEGAQHDQVVIIGKRLTVPGEAVYAVAEQRRGEQVIRVRARLGCLCTFFLRWEERVFRRRRRGDTTPVEINARVCREIRMECNPQQAAF